MSYVYIESESGTFTVGHYAPDAVYTDGRYMAKWVPESVHSTRDTAIERVSYLNGGAAQVPRQQECPNCAYTFSVRRKRP
jgi:hypothetical protein